MRLNASRILKVLGNNKINKTLDAQSNATIVEELHNNLLDTEDIIKKRTIEEAIKFILWNGLCNQYGMFGPKKELSRSSKDYLNKSFSRGKLLSIDFGTSNLGHEFSYTHAGIVIADYTKIVVVIPLTTMKQYKLSNMPNDIRKSIIPIYKKDYKDLREDSYILMHQIRAVSKNRITRVITSLAKSDIMRKIESFLSKNYTPYMKKIHEEEIKRLHDKIRELEKIICEQHTFISEVAIDRN